MNYPAQEMQNRSQISGFVAWFARHSLAIGAAETTCELLDRATEAVSQLTGVPVIVCPNDIVKDRLVRDSEEQIQVFSIVTDLDARNITLAVLASELPDEHREAVQALLAVIQPRALQMVRMEHHKRRDIEESVMADLLTLLAEHEGDYDLDARIRRLATASLSPNAAAIAIEALATHETHIAELQHVAGLTDSRLLNRFVRAVRASRHSASDPEIDASMTQYLDALSNVTLAAASTHDLRELYQAVRNTLKKVLTTDAMLIAMVPAGQDDPITVFRSERDTPYFEHVALSPPFQEAMRVGQPFIIDDLPETLYAPEHRFGDPKTRVRSLAGAPLVANDTVSGLIVVQSYEPGVYRMEDANLLLDVGRSIAVALERATLLDRLRAQALRETALRTVAERLATTLDTRELLKIAVAETAPILSHTLMAAVSIDTSAPMMVNHIAAHGEDRVMDVVGITASSQLDPAGIAARASESRNVEIVTDRNRTVVALPLLADEWCIGIFVITRKGHDAFSEDELTLLNTLGGTLASALRISQLYTNRSQHERDLIEVQRVSRLVSSSLNPDAILNEIITSLPRLFDSEGCSVRMVEGDDLVPLAEYGSIVASFASRIPLASSLAGTIIRDKAVVGANDLHTHPVTSEHARKNNIQVRGWLGAPMIDADGEAIGVLAIHSDQPREWSDRDMVLLSTLAGSATLAIQNAWRFERTRDVLLASIESLAAAVDAKDPTTLNHSRNVAEYARGIAAGLNCSADEVEQIALAGLLHDVGKIGIPDRILQKPGSLDEAEWEQMKTHVTIGEQILSGNPLLYPILPMVRHHHERWDGLGYPDNLMGTDIPLGAAIVGLADAIDTMATSRPYRHALNWNEVCDEIAACAGRQFHPDASRVFLDLVGTGDISPLSNGRSTAGGVTESLPGARSHSLDARALMIFHGVAREVRALTDLDTFIANTSTVIQDVMEVAEVGIFLVDSSTDAIVFSASPSDRIKGKRDLRRDVGQGVVGWVIQHAAPLMIPDVTLDDRFIGRPGSKTRSELAVPLVVDGQVIGAINVESERVSAFSDMDIRLLTATADHIAQTIQVARLHNRFKQLAATDALTGLANHRAFYERLDEEIRHAALTDGVLTVAIMDVDQLKTINDTYGHLTGDAALREIARVLKDRCRRSDFVCRYGGDEFAVILADTDLAGADRAVAHIVDGIAAASLSGDTYKLPLPTGAWGMATYPDDGVRASELVRVADMRMYSHKHFVRNHQFNPHD